ALVSLALGASIAIAICWLAAIGVRERALLERRTLTAPARPLRVGRALALGAALSVATSSAGGLLEAYLHWRAGLGWHGLHCLVGPVHRDAGPILGALSLLAVATHGAVEHLVAWARRLVALIAARLPRLRGAGRVFSSTARLRSLRVRSAAAPRGPPVGSLLTT